MRKTARNRTPEKKREVDKQINNEKPCIIILDIFFFKTFLMNHGIIYNDNISGDKIGKKLLPSSFFVTVRAKA